MNLIQQIPNRSEIEEIIKNSTIELLFCPNEYEIDTNGDKEGAPSEVFVFWNCWEKFQTFPASMSLIDLITYMNEQNKANWIFDGEFNIKRELKAIRKAENDLLN